MSTSSPRYHQVNGVRIAMTASELMAHQEYEADQLTRQAERADREAEAIVSRESARAKLLRLGLTESEIDALNTG
jgi:hypothetical protein